MKKQYLIFLVVLMMSVLLQGCGTDLEITDGSNSTETLGAEPLEAKITEEMAREGVYQYCRSMYDWSITEEDPDAMYVELGEETESEYQVIFRSYTGALVYFYVDKADGMTRMVEYVPVLDIEEEAGTIHLYDYLA